MSYAKLVVSLHSGLEECKDYSVTLDDEADGSDRLGSDADTTKLLDGPGGYNYRNVQRWSSKVPGKDIFALDKIFFPGKVAICFIGDHLFTCTH